MGPVPRRVTGSAPSGVRTTTGATPVRRVLVAGGVLGATLALASCGFGAQTNQPYHPAEGINFDVGTYQTQPAVKVRNLVIVATGSDAGYLSASMTSAQSDESLTGVSATQLNQDGTDGSALSIAIPDPVQLEPGLTVLTDGSAITVTGPVQAGLTARVSLTFAKAGQQTVVTTVVDGSQPPWSGVTFPSSSASPSATPSS